MWWAKKKRDKKKTLVFKIKNGTKRTKPQNILDEQADSDCCEEEPIEQLESREYSIEGENVNG